MIKLWRLFYESVNNLIDHDGVEHAGYMSFLTILSLFPFLIFITAITGFLGNSTIGIEIIDSIQKSLPSDLTQALLPRINEIKNGPPTSLLTISIIGAIWTASSSFEGIRTILNRVYHVKTLPNYFLRRVRSIIEFLIMSIFLVVGTTILISLPYLINILENIIGEGSGLKNIFMTLKSLQLYFNGALNSLYIFVILFMSLIFIYYQIPNAKIRFLDLIPGTILVIILWFSCAQCLKFYFLYFKQINLIYGSLVGVIAALLFFFFIHMILIWGAEFNYLYSTHLKNEIK